MKLNFGCGEDIKEGYVNADVRNLPGVDVVLATKHLVLPWSHETFDEIFAHDVLEHFHRVKANHVVFDFWRILKPGGILYVCSPNILQIAQELFLGNITPGRAEALLYGGQQYPENTHMCGWTPATMKAFLMGAGFSSVEPWERSKPVSEFNQCWKATK